MKSIRMDNSEEFTSKTFDDFYEAQGIDVEHQVAHVHTQNELAESLIRRMQIVARMLLMRSKLPKFAWEHVVLHENALIILLP